MVSKNALKALTHGFNKAKEVAGQGDFPSLPDGSYIGRLSGEIAEASSSGKIQCVWCYEVTEGEHTGFKQMDYQGVEHEVGQQIFARALTILDYDLNTCDPLGWEQLLKDISTESPLVRFTVKTNTSDGREFHNTTLNKLVESGNTVTHEAETDTVDTKAVEVDYGKKDKKKKKDKVKVGSHVWFELPNGEVVSGLVEAVNGKKIDIKPTSVKGDIVKGVKIKSVDLLKEDETPF